MLIVIESIDGAGKGAQRELAVKRLQEEFPLFDIQGMEFPHKGEPYSIYKYLLHDALHGKTTLNNETWFLAWLLDKVLFKEILHETKGSREKHLICDGYYTTTIAYQSFVESAIEMEKALELGEYFNIPKSDINIFLNTNIKTALKRKQGEEGHEEGLDKNESDQKKQKKIESGYKHMIKNGIWGDWVEVDGNGALEEVNELVLQNIRKIL